jgi:ABC-type multidrug transport system fused ATPase/permease subunit
MHGFHGGPGGPGGGGGRGGGVGPRRAQDPWTAFRKCIPLAKPILPLLTVGLICTLIGVYLGQQPPRIFQYTIDTIIGGKQYNKLAETIGYYVAIIVVGQVIGSLSGYWMSIAGQRVLHALRMKLYEKFQALSLSYYDNKRIGDLLSRITNDVNQVEGLIVNTTNALMRQLFGVGIALCYMLNYSVFLTLLVLIPVPFIGVGLFFFTRKIRMVYRSIREATGMFSAKLQENLSGMRVIKAFSREPIEQALVQDTSNQLMGSNIKATRMTSIFFPALQTVSTAGTIIVLGVGANLISRDLFTIGALTAFSMYVSHFYQPIGDFIRTFDSIQRALASGERIFEVLDSVPEVMDPKNPAIFDNIRGEVEFRDVSFQYATGAEVLHHVSVTTRPGEVVALVGQSGAGKTSFVNLIPRFYDTTAGAVCIDGVDVRDAMQSDVRKHIAIVLQESFLFNGTVKENLRFGRLEASDEELEAAAVAANAHEFIEKLADGYDTEIGERGIKLSGGQKQRLAIARAILANPRILILDEATSSVDSTSEHLIHQALEHLMIGRTTFIIAHRLSTVRSADQILVLHDGNIVERGKHDELITQDGVYAEMCRQQFWNEKKEVEEIFN